MIPSLPNRPLPDEPRAIADIIENFDYVRGLFNPPGLDCADFVRNGVVTAEELATVIAQRLGINSGGVTRRGFVSASNELNTTNAEVALETLTIHLGGGIIHKVLLIGQYQVEMRASDVNTQQRGWVESITDNQEVFVSTSTGNTSYSLMSATIFRAATDVPLSSSFDHQFGIRYGRSSGAGTVFIRNRSLSLFSVVFP